MHSTLQPQTNPYLTSRGPCHTPKNRNETAMKLANRLPCLSRSFYCKRPDFVSQVPGQRLQFYTPSLAGLSSNTSTHSRSSISREQLSVFADNAAFHLRGKPQRRTKDIQFSLSQRPKWDVLGLGQAMVDFSATVNDGFIDELGVTDLEKGGRACVCHKERGKILDALDGSDYKLSAGGSLSNTLVALSRLGTLAETQPTVSVACSLGPDALGDFYRNKLDRAGVKVLSSAADEGTTGSVIVLTTPDANRTMLSCWGTSATLEYNDLLDQALGSVGVLMIEGYLWEMPDTIETIKRSITKARAKGTIVALTASDASCVDRHGEEFWELLESGDVDIFFANAAEARAMAALRSDPESACGQDEQAATKASISTLAEACNMVVVTDGQNGSYLVHGNETAHVPIDWRHEKPVDTCGAGDSYAAGVLYGFLTGADLKTMGEMGACTASSVIMHSSARLSKDDVEGLRRSPVFQRHHAAKGG
eukprot:CAMPEP_0197854406 /NCGR_PEP_ID=MMETSP1438-20131217/24621_1 /TAXON_ID=1461541 /ORGANISM="Pterosperma sp., Strain CCMP1384" /LENGTH=477 /DNA_ID=CAMNT_0043469135 /DNA_START=134 /DNA_END=1563 /DNA_ORIENTATION=-